MMMEVVSVDGQKVSKNELYKFLSTDIGNGYN
jgi:hypothetical protein